MFWVFLDVFDVFGCFWVFLVVFGCFWLFLVAFVCFGVFAGVCGFLRGFWVFWGCFRGVSGVS